MKSPKGYLTWQDVFGRTFIGSGGSSIPVDKSQLISIIDYWDSSSSEYPPENYTPESYQAVLDAYAIAVAVRDNGEATQEEVDEAYTNLLNAISGLEEVPAGECVYPLDVKPELINLLGFEPFNVHDECGHDLTCTGEGSHAAISQEAAEALISGGQIPEEHILPPAYLGDGIYAVEYFVSVTNVEDKEGIFAIAGGGYRPLTPEHGGGNFNVAISRENSEVVMRAGIISHDQQEMSKSFIDKTSIRLGIYYNTADKQVGFIIDGDDVGYLGEYTHDEPFILVAAKQGWVVPEYNLGADVSIKVFTKGKDLLFTYPEGTVGLDGKPVPNQPQPDPIPTTIGEFVGGGLYAGDINIDGEDYAIIVATSAAGNPSLKWKTTNTFTDSSSNNRDGWANTLAMIDAGIAAHPAAEHCVNWRGGGHGDWYLGSQDEWSEIYKNRSVNNLWSELALPTSGTIWSSRQHSTSSTRSMDASSGSWHNNYKTTESAVRPIRRIKLAE